MARRHPIRSTLPPIQVEHRYYVKLRQAYLPTPASVIERDDNGILHIWFDKNKFDWGRYEHAMHHWLYGRVYPDVPWYRRKNRHTIESYAIPSESYDGAIWLKPQLDSFRNPEDLIVSQDNWEWYREITETDERRGMGPPRRPRQGLVGPEAFSSEAVYQPA